MLKKLKMLQLRFLEWFVDKNYSLDEIAEYDKQFKKKESPKTQAYEASLPGGNITFKVFPGTDIPAAMKEQIMAKMGFPPDAPQQFQPAPKPVKNFSDVDNTDMLILNNLGHWLSSSGQDGITEDGLPILRSTLDDHSRQKANELFIKMLGRFEKHIDLKNNGSI